MYQVVTYSTTLKKFMNNLNLIRSQYIIPCKGDAHIYALHRIKCNLFVQSPMGLTDSAAVDRRGDKSN